MAKLFPLMRDMLTLKRDLALTWNKQTLFITSSCWTFVTIRFIQNPSSRSRDRERTQKQTHGQTDTKAGKRMIHSSAAISVFYLNAEPNVDYKVFLFGYFGFKCGSACWMQSCTVAVVVNVERNIDSIAVHWLDANENVDCLARHSPTVVLNVDPSVDCTAVHSSIVVLNAVHSVTSVWLLCCTFADFSF